MRALGKANILAAAVVLLGAVATGCTQEAQSAPVQAIPTTVRQPPASERLVMPGGWRDLKFGMSEMDVKKLIHKYRNDPGSKWEQSPATSLPTVRLKLHKIDDVLVDGKRFHQWSIRKLDDGAELVNAWHDRGKLVAIQVRGRARPDVFIQKASDVYGVAPQHARFKFFDSRARMEQVRDVALWSGDDVTAFVWIVESIPILLLWSNAAMEGRAADYQDSLDAPAAAVNEAERAKEKGTKF